MKGNIFSTIGFALAILFWAVGLVAHLKGDLNIRDLSNDMMQYMTCCGVLVCWLNGIRE